MAGIPPYPPVPSPGTWTARPLAVPDLRDQVTDGVTFLANRPAFSAYSTSGATIPGGSSQAVTLDTDEFDTWGGHSPLGSHPENYYCQAAGWHIAEAFVPLDWQSSTAVTAGANFLASTSAGQVTHEGQQIVAAGSYPPGCTATDLIQLTRSGTAGDPAADYIQMQAYASSSMPLSGTSPAYPRLSVRWVSSGQVSSLGVPSNASWPSPGSYITTDWLNANITDAVSFLANPPVFRCSYAGTTQTLGTSAWASGSVITLSTVGVDNFSGWDFTTSAWTVPVSGLYYAAGQVGLGLTATGQSAAGIFVNGTATWGDSIDMPAVISGHIQVPCFRFRVRLTAGDTVSLAGFQGTGADAGVRAPSHLILAWESS